MTELKPCPFCGVMPHIYWEAWKDISPDAGVWKLEANHKDSCYITHINGTNISGRSSARRLSQLVEWWNHREELFGNSEQLESGHEKDHVADPGKMVGDLISRQAAIDALARMMPRSYTPDGSHPADEEIFRAQEVFADCIEALEILPSAQPDHNADISEINKFIDGLEEIFADIRERHVDDSVCGLCEYDGAYMGQSGDWCNECPGFDKDDCFKLSDETRKKWIEEIVNTYPDHKI